MEQFYCTANSCKQDLGTSSNSSDWTCQNLQCHCFTNTTFCGAVHVSDLSNVLNNLTGTLEISCDAVSSQNNTASCSFKQQTITQVFGPSGLGLSGCTFGECVAQDVIDTASGNSTGTGDDASHGSSLSGGVIAGLAVVGGLIGLALVFLFFGWLAQRRARRSGANGWTSSFGGVTAAWTDISYFVPTNHSVLPAAFARLWKGRDASEEQKVVLDNVSGRVEPGQMMAILGPSGISFFSPEINLSFSPHIFRCWKDNVD